MPHHFIKATVQAAIYCNRCGKETQWKIADGRRQYCLVCYEKRRIADAEKPKETVPTTGDLFQ